MPTNEWTSVRRERKNLTLWSQGLPQQQILFLRLGWETLQDLQLAGCTCWTYHAISRKQAVLGLGMSWGCTTRMILTTRNRRPTRSRRMSRRLLLARLVLSPELVKSTSSSTHEEVTTNTSSLRSEKVALWTAQTQRGNCVSTRSSTLVGPRTAPFHLQADGQFHVQSSAQTNPRMPSAIRCKQTSSRSMTHKLDNKTGCPASLASG